MKYRYKAIKVDDTTWMVRRWDEHNEMTEAVVRDCPDSWDNEDVIHEAVQRDSWA